MTFEPDIDRTPGFAILQEGIGDQLTIEFRLGTLPGARKRVLMSVSLLDLVQDICDIRFGYRLQDVDRGWDVSPMDFTVTSKDVFVPKGDRAAVRRLICRSVVELAAYRQPAALTMSTFYRDLPPQALSKYADIESALSARGWRTTRRYRDETGIDRWLFETRSPSAAPRDPKTP